MVTFKHTKYKQCLLACIGSILLICCLSSKKIIILEVNKG